MSSAPESPLVPAFVGDLAARVDAAGGRLLVVGGWVRDALCGRDSKDLDCEIFGLDATSVDSLLSPHGFTGPVGKQFPVWRHTREGIDIALPRQSVSASLPPGASTWKRSQLEVEFADAARARDLTINAMGFDPVDGRVIDPLGGREDLASRRLRAADPNRFGVDPLRVLRVARFAGQLEATIDPALAALCREIEIGALPVERLAGELRRILLDVERPWRSIEALEALGHLEAVPPLAELKGVPQDPRWHPEGDVFVHTGLVVDRAAERASRLPRDRAEILMWSALCHDLGKPGTTEVEADGRVRSLGHEIESERITRAWLGELRLGTRLIEAVAVLVRHHLAPSTFVSQPAGAKGYRRMARRLANAGVTMRDLEAVARVDHLGRTTGEAMAGEYRAGDAFLARARELEIAEGVPSDVVSARDVMRAGVPAGPEVGELLRGCREIQDETGGEDAAEILRRALAERERARSD